MLELEDCVSDILIERSDTCLPESIKQFEIPPSFGEFFENNLLKNEPCIFKSWLIEQWTATKLWVDDDSPHIDYFLKHFGEVKVPVANCKSQKFDSHQKDFFSIQDYFHLYKNTENLLYLKDWHFTNDFPSYEPYTTPIYFASDWLNEYWSSSKKSDDYKFVYIGPTGTWTPLHADVFRSYSWSSNLCGRKRWLLFPPNDEKYLTNKFGDLIYDIENFNSAEFENYEKAKEIEIIQEKGETIFVPSNWFHQVWNLEDTISINHNWINGTNIDIVLTFFFKSLEQVEKSIEDCKNMENWIEQVQLILSSVHGMNLCSFMDFICTIALRRIQFLKGDATVSSFSGIHFGKNLVMFDVMKLIWSIETVLDRVSPENLEYLNKNFNQDYTAILEELKSFA